MVASTPNVYLPMKLQVTRSRTSDGSITHGIAELKAGKEGEEQQELWNRYFQRMVAIARSKLAGSPNGLSDEDDRVLSAFERFFERTANGRFPQLTDRTDLWRLLMVITARKAMNQYRKETRYRAHVQGESVLGADSRGHQT